MSQPHELSALRHAAAPGQDGQLAVDMLVKLLDLEKLEENLFRGHSPAVTLQRTFGGQVAGQALVAAGRTVGPEWEVHSLHSYFLRPGDPEIPIIYIVQRVRDGRRFSTRHVEAIQHGKAIFTLSASFTVPQPGKFEHQEPMPDVPRPESLPSYRELVAGKEDKIGPGITLPRPVELRYVSTPPWERTRDVDEPLNRIWMKVDGRLPDDKFLHLCALTYASDMTLLDSSLTRHGLTWMRDNVEGASLDHAVWFHRPFRADEWFFYQSGSPSGGGARGFSLGQIWSHDGRLVASTAQEGLLHVT
ncbi:acyl-CoA thioesterase [Cumulibacter manganitolerans]|uniref:acyl-CoA thioesterase n=1 Tax=Cumulibacter manganitolerans TaxID=1884992 RepID=UPI0012957645|nr:acyl-CoA thioesterase II [Cumulibacter manganitolerans]